MNHRDAAGISAIVLLYCGIFGFIWLRNRREKKRYRQEKMTGQLPIRRSSSPPRPLTLNPVLLAAVVVPWVFAPVGLWVLAATVLPLLTPAPARIYLPPLPTFSHAVRSNLYWWLFWAGLALLVWVAERVRDHLTRRFADPILSRAEVLRKAGDLDGAVRALRDAIDADGFSLGRYQALADTLMTQERWPEALKISLDIEDRYRLNLENRRRKALVLCNLGLPEVALSEFKRPNATTPRRLTDACSYCLALFDLGLYDRAWDQLRRAEIMYGRVMIPKAEEAHFRE